MTMKAKCTNCGDELEQEQPQNWEAYCNKEECRDAAIEKVINLSG
ncbi:hypothetical protein [Chengkuizengella axinellae]|uniref:Uncharacterized protein n=1 Tax=Chengkuizengella axinellae TaxID=3064388 RepID=A0ABT9IYA9_9BACL|nr:hypothetical protein [Chengkuizengella sp. 2205SS18-9]MDP5274342.1 hypothetical protein [Chengkuizengella sp. 2205SS18-9]